MNIIICHQNTLKAMLKKNHIILKKSSILQSLELTTCSLIAIFLYNFEIKVFFVENALAPCKLCQKVLNVIASIGSNQSQRAPNENFSKRFSNHLNRVFPWQKMGFLSDFFSFTKKNHILFSCRFYRRSKKNILWNKKLILREYKTT